MKSRQRSWYSALYFLICKFFNLPCEFWQRHVDSANLMPLSPSCFVPCPCFMAFILIQFLCKVGITNDIQIFRETELVMLVLTIFFCSLSHRNCHWDGLSTVPSTSVWMMRSTTLAMSRRVVPVASPYCDVHSRIGSRRSFCLPCFPCVKCKGSLAPAQSGLFHPLLYTAPENHGCVLAPYSPFHTQSLGRFCTLQDLIVQTQATSQVGYRILSPSSRIVDKLSSLLVIFLWRAICSCMK